MADRATFPIVGVKDQLHLITAELTGGGAATSLVNAESANMGAGEIVSATYTATGKYDLVFRHRYPQLKAFMAPGFVGTTDGLVGQLSEIDVQAKTAKLEVYVGSTPTDMATTDTVYLTFLVRNSGFNT